MNKVYVIMVGIYDYEDGVERPVGVFNNKNIAEEKLKEVQEDVNIIDEYWLNTKVWLEELELNEYIGKEFILSFKNADSISEGLYIKEVKE